MYSEYLGIVFAFVKAFLVGGGICMIAQIVINFTDLTAGKILVAFMLSGVVLQGLGIYQYLVDFAGAGATTPLTGFGYLISKGVREAVNEKGLLGALTGGLTAAAGGTAAALCFGYLAALTFKSRPRG
jgi:stage V sporulation protein AE